LSKSNVSCHYLIYIGDWVVFEESDDERINVKIIYSEIGCNSIKSEPASVSSSDIDIDNTVSLCIFGRYAPFEATILSIALHPNDDEDGIDIGFHRIPLNNTKKEDTNTNENIEDFQAHEEESEEKKDNETESLNSSSAPQLCM
jgi:hypothetical protein